MQHFRYQKNRLHCEQLSVARIAAEVGTPFYLYSQSAIEEQFAAFDRAFASVSHLVCYAVKANSNLAILGLLRRLGSGFDIVSGGELQRALAAGADPHKIIFSGVGKTREEIDSALERDILQFNIESESELDLLSSRAGALHREARIGLRVNPDIDAETHPYHSTGLAAHKFGIPLGRAVAVLRKSRRLKGLRITGLGFHIGSQITRVEPFTSALGRLKALLLEVRSLGADIRHLDLGGGLGITYKDESPPGPEKYGEALIGLAGDLGCTIVLEPGRAIVGNAGALVTRVLHVKQSDGKRFVVVDAAMNDLIRPSLYGAYHHILPETRTRRSQWVADVVGPVCETGDFLARAREIGAVRPGELLAVMSAGAYGFVSSSNYNSRPRIAEVLVRDKACRIVRRRETFADLIRGESRSPF